MLGVTSELEVADYTVIRHGIVSHFQFVVKRGLFGYHHGLDSILAFAGEKPALTALLQIFPESH